MESLHTKEEIIKYDKMTDLANELSKLAVRYSGYFNTTPLIEQANAYKNEVQIELDEYKHLVGTKATAPASIVYNVGNRREGIIEKITHFNAFSNSVICKFNYNSGGWDNHAIKDLEILK